MRWLKSRTIVQIFFSFPYTWKKMSVELYFFYCCLYSLCLDIDYFVFAHMAHIYFLRAAATCFMSLQCQLLRDITHLQLIFYLFFSFFSEITAVLMYFYFIGFSSMQHFRLKNGLEQMLVLRSMNDERNSFVNHAGDTLNGRVN